MMTQDEKQTAIFLLALVLLLVAAGIVYEALAT